MSDFFHGWRRKAGCVTLVMAFAVTGLWARSRFVRDTVDVTIDHQWYCIDSFGGNLVWSSMDGYLLCGQSPLIQDHWPSWQSERFVKEGFVWMILKSHFPHTSHITIAIPLSLLSGCLILWPGKRKIAESGDARNHS